MTHMYRFFVMTGMMAAAGLMAIAQDVAPLPPPPAAPAPRAWSFDLAMPPEPADWPEPAIAAIAPLPPRTLMEIDAWRSLPAIAPVPPMPAMPPMPPVLAAIAMAADAGDEQDERAQEDAQRAREEAQRAREEAQREREQAQREREMERRNMDRDESEYRRAKSYLDRKSYDKAIESFSRVIENKGSRADGAYYWRAYSLNRVGKRDEALASLSELQKNYPKSHWLDDAK